MNGHLNPPSVWIKAQTDAGRTYYWHRDTKATRWDTPEEFMEPIERALIGTPWKAYQNDAGRRYYAHNETKQTSWEIPAEVAENLKKFQPPVRPAAAHAPAFVAGGPMRPPQNNYRDRDDYERNDRIGPDRQIGYRADPERGYRADPERSANLTSITSQTDPEYSSFEEAEAAFMKLLRRVGAQPEWSWEQTVRATVKDPQYRALKDPKDRKSAFEKYVVEVRAQEKDKEKERLAKLRSDFSSMLGSHPEIKHYTRWKTARPIIEDESIFRSAKSDDERRQLFEEYIVDLKKSNAAEEAKNRSAALDELMEILRALNLEPYTRWSHAQEILQSNSHIKNDEKFQSLTKLDILKAFDNHIKALERSFNDQRQKQKALKTRRERQAREGFLSLLKDLKSENKINANSKWTEVHPLVENDDRYTAMLGNSGSSPLELFWDLIEEEDRALRLRRNEAMDVLDDQHFEVTPKTTFDEFLSVMKTDRRTADLDSDYVKLIFERIRDKVMRRSEDEKHHAERHQLRIFDKLRSKIKHLEPPVALGDTWDQVRPRLEKFEEYRALDSDELRRSAFDKTMRRLKERDDEERRDHRPRDRGDRYSSHRDRERDYRDNHTDSHRRRRTRTRSPERDAYQEDRKKAQENREKQYRKGGSSTGLSPPYRRDRDDRERDRTRDRGDRYDRGSRQVSLSHYDRERREREAERERDYVSRADPRDRGSELDYGDSRPGSMRRRRDSDVGSPGSRRDNKRVRRSRTPAAPPTPAPAAEDPGLRSGSEEGELAED
ncbi:uncharacterized protein BDZ99DRAFT_507304 [Mytilinidion resinicola]|uniref:Formin binding protein-like protein n=1 Tax=Mytilinidion resinicola TaxID=574789 RepID=A0A6A6YZ94_9PEZI|nr:uncharacterized protein BDZ99DRAFT_507304 [Mytilinidion resinicola]KAF2813277.1 hypothetical protein BDZ99DRAFT_507304 [Mytilinidion resinicola]